MLKHKLVRKLIANESLCWFGNSEARIIAYALQIINIGEVVISDK